MNQMIYNFFAIFKINFELLNNIVIQIKLNIV